MRAQRTLKFYPTGRRVPAIEKTGRTEKTLLAHLPFIAALGQIGVSLAARDALEPWVTDVILHVSPRVPASAGRVRLRSGRGALKRRQRRAVLIDARDARVGIQLNVEAPCAR